MSEHFNPIDATRYLEECMVNRSILRYYWKNHIFVCFMLIWFLIKCKWNVTYLFIKSPCPVLSQLFWITLAEMATAQTVIKTHDMPFIVYVRFQFKSIWYVNWKFVEFELYHSAYISYHTPTQMQNISNQHAGDLKSVCKSNWKFKIKLQMLCILQFYDGRCEYNEEANSIILSYFFNPMLSDFDIQYATD